MAKSVVVYCNQPTSSGEYVYLFALDGVPAYVGKGAGRRVFAHERAALYHSSKTRWQSELARAINTGRSISVWILGEGLSTAEAKALEVCSIDQHGRRDLGTGTLYNRTAGGDGLSREDAIRIFKDPKTKRKLIRARARQARDSMYRARLSIAQRRSWADPEIRARRVAINRATLAMPGVREKQAASCAITNQRPEVRARRRAAAEALHKDPQYQLKLYAALRRAANEPGRKEQLREQMRARNQDPVYTKRRIEGIRRYWARLRARSK